jgi:hypothetical protein
MFLRIASLAKMRISMREQPGIIGAFNDRVRQHVADALPQYHDEQRAVSHEMPAKGLGRSGPHLRRRVEVPRKWMQALTDQCFERCHAVAGNAGNAPAGSRRLPREVILLAHPITKGGTVWQ